jgi:probable F420-dependent oxidoreductase
MKIDYYFPPAPPDNAVEQARRAQALGFDGFFTAETSHEPFLPLAFAAQAAPGLELGTAIAVAFPRSPMVTAQIAWDLASISDGHFILGLGTQVKAHITRRFATEWMSPGPRMREYIGALRAIFSSWQEGTPLRFEGEHYKLSLMTPFFNPGPIPHPDIPIAIAGVGPYMSRLAGELCQGFHVHPFHTVRYLDELVLPQMTKGAQAADRTLEDVQRIVTVFLVTGHDQAEMEQMAGAVKMQIAFYASTPTYRNVLEVHGWDVGEQLTALSKRGEWDAMADLISDEMMDEVAVRAPLDRLGPAIKERYGNRVQRVGFYTMPGISPWSEEELGDLVASLK